MSTRQAEFNKRQRAQRRKLGLCQNCGQRKPCGNPYCGRNPETRRAQQAALMRRRRAAGKA